MSIPAKTFFSTEDQVPPWAKLGAKYPDKKQPITFTKMYITPTALITLLNHGIRGGENEIMGFVYGRVVDGSYYICDTVPTSVLGTETRVEATNESQIEMIEHQTATQTVGREQRTIGWYHSHPSYGCWLSTPDIITQERLQKMTRPFVALVVDPIQTASSNQVHLGAFRVFLPHENKETNKGGLSMIPIEKKAEFDQNASQYYELELKFYLTETDNKILKYILSRSWINQISASPLEVNSKYLLKLTNQASHWISSINLHREIPKAEKDEIKKLLNQINSNRETGISIAQMKRKVFG